VIITNKSIRLNRDKKLKSEIEKLKVFILVILYLDYMCRK